MYWKNKLIQVANLQKVAFYSIFILKHNPKVLKRNSLFSVAISCLCSFANNTYYCHHLQCEKYNSN